MVQTMVTEKSGKQESEASDHLGPTISDQRAINFCAQSISPILWSNDSTNNNWRLPVSIITIVHKHGISQVTLNLIKCSTKINHHTHKIGFCLFFNA